MHRHRALLPARKVSQIKSNAPKDSKFWSRISFRMKSGSWGNKIEEKFYTVILLNCDTVHFFSHFFINIDYREKEILLKWKNQGLRDWKNQYKIEKFLDGLNFLAKSKNAILVHRVLACFCQVNFFFLFKFKIQKREREWKRRCLFTSGELFI